MSSAAQMREVADALTARRQCLAAAPNPAVHLDYVVSLSGSVTLPDGDRFTVAVVYVPDRATIAPQSFADYLAQLGADPFHAAEEIGAAVLGDFDSEIVPRYLRVIVTADGSPRHEARFEARQPGWANDGALARLA
jgi:hypothetical protein